MHNAPLGRNIGVGSVLDYILALLVIAPLRKLGVVVRPLEVLLRDYPKDPLIFTLFLLFLTKLLPKLSKFSF